MGTSRRQYGKCPRSAGVNVLEDDEMAMHYASQFARACAARFGLPVHSSTAVVWERGLLRITLRPVALLIVEYLG
jgi:hypothetical protein